jgi:ketosteroid isomerase-like protein
MRQLLTVAFCALLVSGCASSAEHPTRAVDRAAQQASLMEVDQAMFEDSSTSDNPLETVLAFFLDDARVLPPAAPMAVGKEEIRTVWAAMYALPEFSLRWSPATADVDGAGDLGYTIGTYRMEYREPGGGDPIAIDGKYMTVWRRQLDGTWRVAVDMFNAN